MDEYLCNRCKGRGTYSTKTKDKRLKVCRVCEGSGKLNWIDNVFGKEEKSERIEFLDIPSPPDINMMKFLFNFYLQIKNEWKVGVNNG